MSVSVSRREVLRAAAVWGGVSFLGSTAGVVQHLAARAGCEAPLGDLVGLVPLHGDRPQETPFDRMVGGPGLDARKFTDLSKLQPERLVTPTAEVFIRTSAPRELASTPTPWSIAVRDPSGKGAASLALDALSATAKPMGAHLIECSGNSNPDNFGLMSVAEWDGVPLADVLSRLGARAGASGVLVGGVDDLAQESRSSNPGASWIFPLATLERLGAFFAVRMNGEPLTADHGAPVRLVVPGWFGCSWIKWVNELRFVGDDAPTTLQMMEFSLRTHQGGVPTLARDYVPPTIDVAATPIRIEKRRVDGRVEYRIVGIVWGGDRPVERLSIRFNPGETPVPFSICPTPQSHRTWSLWDYRWRPSSPGVYNIALRVPDPAVRTRRLDVSFYVRRVVIDDV